MKNKRWFKLIGAICLAAVIAIPFAAGCAAPAPAPAPAPVEEELETLILKFATSGGEASINTILGQVPWPDYVEKVTFGRVKVDRYFSQTLVKRAEQARAVETGLADFTMLWNPSIPGKYPLMDLFHLPGLMSNQATSNVVMWDLFQIYPQFEEQFGDKVVRILNTVHMRSDLHTIKPIRNLEELQGKVIAATNAPGAEVLAALGASPTIMVGADAYLAAEKGVIDGIFSAWGWVEIFHLSEVTEYHTLLGLSPGTASWLFNAETWKKFTPVEQMLLKQYEIEGMYHMMQGNVYSSMGIRDTIPKDRFIEWPPEEMSKVKELFRPAWDKWAEEMEALGYPGKAILADAIRLLDGYIYG